MNKRLPNEITTVHINRSQISDDTGCFQWKERPKSPSRMMFVIQRKYCSTIGLMLGGEPVTTFVPDVLVVHAHHLLAELDVLGGAHGDGPAYGFCLAAH